MSVIRIIAKVRVRAWGVSLLAAAMGLLAVLITTSPQSQAAPLAAPTALNLSLRIFASGLTGPVNLVNAGPGDERLFVVEQQGVIKIIQPDGSVLPTPFLDITDRVDDSADEEGLLGLAFDPDHPNNGYFYVNYINTSGSRRTRISRFSLSLTDTNVANPASETILLTVDQHSDNHNAGDMHFGPDGYLYIPLGDGGGSGDGGNHAQSMDELLGKIVRIDVNSGPGDPPDCDGGVVTGGYTIPADNPFSDGAGGDCDEIWAVGLRNPWRSSFDRETGDLFIGDVGQGEWEEVDFYPTGQAGGLNFGWRCYEGNHFFSDTFGCDPIDNYTFPIFEYSSGDGSGNCTVIGGYIYRGTKFPAMYGHYLLADYCSGRLWDLVNNGGTWQSTEYNDPDLTNFGYTAFGEDASGELYLVQRSGTIYAIEESTANLTISKSGPAAVDPGQPITYTLTITSNSALTATNLIVTDTIPAGATYLPGSGGTQVGNVISWTIPSLEPGNPVTETTFAVTATQTIVNDDYGVGGADSFAAGSIAVTTVVINSEIYLPLIAR